MINDDSEVYEVRDGVEITLSSINDPPVGVITNLGTGNSFNIGTLLPDTLGWNAHEGETILFGGGGGALLNNAVEAETETFENTRYIKPVPS